MRCSEQVAMGQHLYIEVHWNSVIEDIKGDSKVQYVFSKIQKLVKTKP